MNPLERYHDSGGTECPICGSTDLTGRSVETGELEATQVMDCASCDASWVDGYVHKSITFINRPD